MGLRCRPRAWANGKLSVPSHAPRWNSTTFGRTSAKRERRGAESEGDGTDRIVLKTARTEPIKQPEPKSEWHF